MLPAKRKWSDAPVLGSDSHQLPVLSLDSFGVVCSFVERTDIRAMSCASRGVFDMLQESRAKLRAEWDNSSEGMINERYDDFSRDDGASRWGYYYCIESFPYQLLLGRLVLEADDDEFKQAILHGPVLEHLLMLCGTNMQLARNVVANYTFLYNTTSLLHDDFDDEKKMGGWLKDEPGMRLNVSELTMMGKMDDDGLRTCFNSYFDKENFPELGAHQYVQHLVEYCSQTFEDIQIMLSLWMRGGLCDLDDRDTLLEDMHMTTTVHDFITYLHTTFHMRAVRRYDEMEEEQRLLPGRPTAAERVDGERVDGNWFENVTPAGIYLRDAKYKYVRSLSSDDD